MAQVNKADKISADEALRLISQEILFEGFEFQGELEQFESEWEGDAEIYRFEFHPYGDSITYDSISVNSMTKEITDEQIEYDYAQEMLEYWKNSLPDEMHLAP